ncbi:MAG: NYN domain-containing protein [Elusimicrobiales bacterium]
MKKVWMYIDGFNFYYSIKNNKQVPIGLGWCNFRKLAEKYFLEEGEHLAWIKYYTALVNPYTELNSQEVANQKIWLDAVRSVDRLIVIPGYFEKHAGKMRQEKLTDTRLAVDMLADTMDLHAYDKAILLSGDFDFSVAVEAVMGKGRRNVDIWVPPGQSFQRWQSFVRDITRKEKIHKVRCNAITEDMLANSRLPDTDCPEYWQLPQEFTSAETNDEGIDPEFYE